MRDWVPIIVAVCSLAAVLINYRSTKRVSQSNEEGNHLKWLQAARDDAQVARKGADAARVEADEAKHELSQTKRELVELNDLVDELTRWTLRVVSAKNDRETTLAELGRIIGHG